MTKHPINNTTDMTMKPEDHLVDELLKQQAQKDQPVDIPESLKKALAEEEEKTSRSYTWPVLLSSAAVATVAAYVAFQKPTEDTILAMNEKQQPLDSAVTSRERSFAQEAKNKNVQRKPSAPNPSQANVIAAAAISDIAVPDPSINIGDLSAEELATIAPKDFGDGQDFGRGLADAFVRPDQENPVTRKSNLNFKGKKRQEAQMATLTGRRRIDGLVGAKPLDLRRGNQYGVLVDPSWMLPRETPLSTFSVDVDTASYTNFRRAVTDGQPINPDSVRIEEMINYFSYDYAQPEGDAAFGFDTMLSTCPWEENHLLVRVAIQGKDVDAAARPGSNLVFLLDVSGSMNDSRKLPLLQRSMILLLEQLDERDSVSIVVYAGRDAVVLDPTRLTAEGRMKAIQAMENLQSGGGTNGGAGIRKAYELAAQNFVKGGVNRVLLATDGDFNVGTTSDKALVDLVKEKSSAGIYLSVLGLGSGNLNDRMLESISNDGNGNYFFIDSDREARNVFFKKLTGTLVTIAKDVKIQIEFNPAKVQSYRLLGYANRQLKAEDFNNDKVDAGDIGAGHTVTAFYEIVPVGVDSPVLPKVDPLKYQTTDRTEKNVSDSKDWFTLKLRHKAPDGDKSELTTESVVNNPVAIDQTHPDFQFATSVLMAGMKLRNMEVAKDFTWESIQASAGKTANEDEARIEFSELLKKLGK